MAKYSRSAGKDVESALRRRKKRTLKSGPGGKGATVTSRKQAIAIGLSEARAKGKKVPAQRKTTKRKTTKRQTTKRQTTKRKTAKKAAKRKAVRRRSA